MDDSRTTQGEATETLQAHFDALEQLFKAFSEVA